jgi:Mg-chelatase subunit ChlD
VASVVEECAALAPIDTQRSEPELRTLSLAVLDVVRLRLAPIYDTLQQPGVQPDAVRALGLDGIARLRAEQRARPPSQTRAPGRQRVEQQPAPRARYAEIYRRVQPVVERLVGALESSLIPNALRDRQGQRRVGFELDVDRVQGALATGRGWDRLFRRRHRSHRRYRAALVADASASMGDRRLLEAAHCTAALAEALHRLQVETDVVLYGDQFAGGAVVVKPGREPWGDAHRLALVQRLVTDPPGRSSPLLAALEALEAASGADQDASRVLLVLTDGLPTALREHVFAEPVRVQCTSDDGRVVGEAMAHGKTMVWDRDYASRARRMLASMTDAGWHTIVVGLGAGSEVVGDLVPQASLFPDLETVVDGVGDLLRAALDGIA